MSREMVRFTRREIGKFKVVKDFLPKQRIVPKMPPHPGLSVLHDCLEPLGSSVRVPDSTQRDRNE